MIWTELLFIITAFVTILFFLKCYSLSHEDGLSLPPATSGGIELFVNTFVAYPSLIYQIYFWSKYTGVL